MLCKYTNNCPKRTLGGKIFGRTGARACYFSVFLRTKTIFMDKGSLLLVPAGGLANRMRAVMSAYNLCQATGSRLQVVWFRDWALNARFSDIFEPVDESRFSLREAWGPDFIINDRPRRHNLWIPKLPQILAYRGRIYEQWVTR